MNKYIYRVTDKNNDVYWEEDPYNILVCYGTCIETLKFTLKDAEYITDEINGGYFKDE
jgi:hypothetical protein